MYSTSNIRINYKSKHFCNLLNKNQRMEGNVFIFRNIFAIFTLFLQNVNANDKLIQDNTIFIKRHGTATFVCPVMSPESITRWKGPPDLTIYSDGGLVRSSLPHHDRISITGDFLAGEYNLEISNFSSVDEGLYRCVSTLSGQLIDTGFTAKLYMTPKITIEGDKAITLREGETLQMNCTFKLYDLTSLNDSIRWYINDDNNTLDNFSSTSIMKRENQTFYYSQLVIRNTTALYSGYFYCEIDDKITSENVYVTIVYKPKLLTQDTTFNTEKGKAANILLEIKSFEDVEVFWLKPKRGKLGEWKVRKIGNETGNSGDMYCLSTTIVPLQHSHFGNYTLGIRNSIGKSDIEIVITYTHWNIKMSPKNITGNNSDTVILTCQINPKDFKDWEVTIEHTWNDHLIKQFKPSGRSNTYTLTLNYIDFQDTGKYICQLKTPETVFTEYTELLVQGPPFITKINVASFNIGVQIDVYLTSFPPLVHAEWYILENCSEIPITRDGVNVTQVTKSSKVTVASYRVKVPVSGTTLSLRYGNFINQNMTFLCRIRNSYGSDERKIDYLYVQGDDNMKVNKYPVFNRNLPYIIGSPVTTVLCFIIVTLVCLIKRHRRYSQSTLFQGTNFLSRNADADRQQIELNTDVLVSMRNLDDYDEVDENILNNVPSLRLSVHSSYTSLPNYFQLIGQYEDLCRTAEVSDNYLKLITQPSLKERLLPTTKHFSTGNIQNEEKTKWKRHSF